MLATHTHTYKRHRPEHTLLYQLVERHYPEFLDQLSRQGKSLPRHVEKEFEEFLKCGRLEHGFLRVVCDDCKQEKLLAFSCKKRGFCPSCGARRMAESAKLLVDDVLHGYPVRQWVLSLPIPLRLLLARYPKHLSNIMQIIHRAIATDIIHRAGYLKKASKHRSGNLHSAFWQCVEFKHSLSHALFGRRDHSGVWTVQIQVR